MQIKLNYKEVRAFKKVLVGLDENVLEELNKLRKTKGTVITLGAEDVTINIAPEYVEDLMNVYDKFLSILMNQTKALLKTCETYFEEIGEVANKYSEKLPEEDKGVQE